VTLTGLGDRAHLARRGTDLETHVADVVALLDDEGLEDAVLVGHSYAGLVVECVADRRPRRLNAVVYLDTGPLPDGMSIVDVQPPELRDRQRADAEARGDGWLWPVPDRATLETGTFGSAAGLTDEHFRLIAERATPHPYATFSTPVRLDHPAPPGVRRVAVLSADGGLGVEALRRLIAEGDPRASVFADADWELHELPTGHWSMFSLPGPLSDLLHAIAADGGAGG
jgi:pimeloyl-ACP methyl ester carboxylesterase